MKYFKDIEVLYEKKKKKKFFFNKFLNISLISNSNV